MPSGLGVVIDDKSWLPWYNYYLIPNINVDSRAIMTAII